jgi:PAS domain S-box-containing protein
LKKYSQQTESNKIKELGYKLTEGFQTFNGLAKKLISLKEEEDSTVRGLYTNFREIDELLDGKIRVIIRPKNQQGAQKFSVAFQLEEAIDDFCMNMLAFSRLGDFTLIKRFEKNANVVRKYLAVYLRQPSSLKEKQVGKEFSRLVDNCISLSRENVDLEKKENQIIPEFIWTQQVLETLLIREIHVQAGPEPGSVINMVGRASVTGNWLTGLQLLIIGLGIFLTLYLVRSISKPLERLKSLAQTLVQGDLSARGEFTSKDEFGVLGEALNSLAAQRQEAQEARRRGEAQFGAVFTEAPVGICIMDLGGGMLASNPSFQNMLGYRAENLIQLKFQDLLSSEEIPEYLSLWHNLLEGKCNSFQLENQIKRGDGDWLWVRLNSSLIPDADGKPRFPLVLVEDITGQKQSETEIATYQERLRNLVSELSLTEERERRSLATDLHDHIGQNLALAKIKLGALGQQAATSEMRQGVDDIRRSLEEAINYTRSLTFDLGLPVLYDLGFEAAVEWLSDQIYNQHGLNVEVSQGKYPLTLDEPTRILFFRIVRELLNNVVKHAEAHRAQVIITRNGEFLRLIVEDDGVGFDISALASREFAPTFGLFSIRERLKNLGGTLEIQPTLGQGTRVTVTVSLSQVKETSGKS